MEDVRVAAAQVVCPVGKVEANLSKTRQYCQRARDEGAEIICFPELHLTGFWRDKNLYRLAEPIPGPLSEAVVEIAAETGLTVLAGMAEMGGNGAVYNTQIVATPQGLAGKYRKLHINEAEIPYWTYGSELPTFTHPKVKFGIEICYDSHFPEVSTALALKGCELLFFPHASGEISLTAALHRESFDTKKQRWLKYMPARAYDNSLFVVVVNHVGDNGGGNVYPGNSMIIDPQGEVIAEAKPWQEDLVIATLKRDDLVHIRQNGGWAFFLRYRRPELYGMVVEKTI